MDLSRSNGLTPVFLAVLVCIAGCSAMAPSDEGEMLKSEVQLDRVPAVGQAHQGKKVAVAAFVNRSLSQYGFLGDSAPDFLVEFLIEAGFRTVEAKGAQLGKVLDELEYNRSGYVDPATAAEIGKQLGTDYVFVGSITDYEQVRSKGGGGLNVLGYGIDTGGGTITYNIQTAGRLVDIRTREVLASKTASFKKQFKVGGGGLQTPYGGAHNEQEIEVTNETGGKVLQKCLNQLMIDIVRQLNSRS